MPALTSTPGTMCFLFHPTKFGNIRDRGIWYSRVPDGITRTAHVNNGLFCL